MNRALNAATLARALSPWEIWRNPNGARQGWSTSPLIFARQLATAVARLENPNTALGRAIALKAARHARSTFPPQTKGSALKERAPAARPAR